jgi:transcriptional regulatory protein RtcR
MKKKTVVIGILGTSLDAIGGNSEARWDRWRPTIGLFNHEDLMIDQLELICCDTNENLRKRTIADIREISPKTKVNIHEIKFKDAWDFEEVYGKLHQFSLGLSFDINTTDYLVHITTGTHVAQIILFLLVETHYIPGKLIQTAPRKSDKVHASLGEYSIIDLDLSKYDKIAQRFKQEFNNDKDHLKSGINTSNKPFNDLIDKIEKVAIKTKAPLLLTGPTGAGKSKLVKQIFLLKQKKRLVKGIFVEVNCATLRGDSTLSTLFGHKKGSYTGAQSDRNGLLLQAHEGVLFLDEIGDLGLDEQALLLSALEEKEFFPLGSDTKVKADFQLVAGTNHDLGQKVKEGLFREDLLARINVWSFEIPSLASRKEDIEPNIHYEIQKFEEANHQSIRFSTEALQDYLTFSKSPAAIWTANFRDLNASVLRLCTLATSGRIDTETVKEEIQYLKRKWQTTTVSPNEFAFCHQFLDSQTLADIDLFELITLEGVLQVCATSKNLADAGRKLYQSSRQKRKGLNDSDRLKKYLNTYQLTWSQINKGT